MYRIEEDFGILVLLCPFLMSDTVVCAYSLGCSSLTIDHTADGRKM
jgi:hypothetical protein